ncbi:DNA mismatch repair protein MutS [Tepidibacillus infernus]|uniref:DNA mismatch repair protein MutS n=1 Tax=Tepidibacillus decaturensis TaxID=1413211 RepID=A0A135L3P3_9BACI|nr:DNA mismatch repair protein MutS [Tepidibacillus decaturensis]KXG43473.1 DNA mismatch repair protein MutS [Tepidibacillus decaturensis]
MATYTPMIQQYLSIKAEYPDAFLFFRLGDFYEMFFEDAEVASRELEITLTGRDGGVEERIPMCGVPYHSAESYINRLIEKGYKVAMCEQVEDPKTAKGVVKREVIRVITPGTVMEGKVLEQRGNNYLVSVAYDAVLDSFGLSVSDVSTGEFYGTEITRNFEDVIMELSQYHPSEVLIEEDIYQQHIHLLQQVNATYTVWKENIKLEQLNQIVSEHFPHLEPISKSILISAGNLLSYLHKTQHKRFVHFNEFRIYDTNQYMVLDTFTRRNLELTQTSRDQSKKGSLLWLLDQTETAMGSRLLRRWLDKPLLSVHRIEERLSGVEALYNNLILAEDLSDQLKQVYDLERIISKVSYGNATPKDLYLLRKSLERVPAIIQIVIESEADPLKKIVKDFDLVQDVSSLIEKSIVDDPPISLKDGGVIKRGFHQKLDQYYIASTEGKQWLQDLEFREREETGIKSLKVGFNKVFGYYIEVTRSNLSQVPDRYIRKQTLANAERYITEELKEKESQILEADEKMLDLEYQVFIEIRDAVSKQTQRLQQLAQKIAYLDVLLSFAKVSLKYSYVRPTFNQLGHITIKKGRHPVIEAVQKGHPYIPNDVILNQHQEQILLITGPNMAGKSTYMRQIAITVIMAQIGCFVPAESADLSMIDRIFTRIGAGDDLTSGQSTFMVEMTETKQAITQATSNSLILLDEIGRGTSTYDGMALAQAVIEYIHEHVNAKTLFSTHYHELTSLADRFPRIQNVHVNVIEKDGKVVFLHKIEKGKADRSYGIHVAELAGMPKEVIKNAKKILEDLEAQSKRAQESENDLVQLELFEIEPKMKASKKSIDPSLNEKIALYEKVMTQIDSLDLLNMTPMEGFQILYDIQKKLRK